jgi:hypothetical protein
MANHQRVPMFKRFAFLAILPYLVCSCNLFFSTKINFLNSTASYTFTEVKLGSFDYTNPLQPGQAINYTLIDPGTYNLQTRGIDGTLYQWPVPQVIQRGYSYTLTFITGSDGNIQYQVYEAIVD